MHKTLREMPSLDFLRGFEAAGRTLSFTRAAAELFVTQSALSRQVKALEDALGVPLFERRHRALALTRAGEALHRDVTDSLAQIARAVDATRGRAPQPGVTLTTTVSFASLWIIPRLATFRARHPAIEVYVSADDRTVDLARGEVDVAVRYLAEHKVPEGAQRMFGERMLPVVSPQVLRQPRTRLASPADLRNHVLLHLDDPDGMLPWLNWQAWLAANGEPSLRPAGALRFRMYDQLIQAAVAGQGVALGRLPLLAEHLRDGRLVAPFAPRYESARGYYVIVAPHAAARPDVAALAAWLADEAAIARGAVSAPSPTRAPRARAAAGAITTPGRPARPHNARTPAGGSRR
ncbi:MAG TPA: LysR substrate-binding domain-containing protein [Casimicrobiaceae bacterium]|jgi:DNA-binding transcriptional LysR family regulator|nr:LysR substrate-binding domain-containing protein [Casimicrobiaceae bacterium]